MTNRRFALGAAALSALAAYAVAPLPQAKADPIRRGTRSNAPLGTGDLALVTSITPTRSGTLRITAMASAEVALRMHVKVTTSGPTLDPGTLGTLSADTWHTFMVSSDPSVMGGGVNFSLSGAATLRFILVDEVYGDVSIAKASSGGGGVANPLTADLSVGGNLLTSTDGTAQLELANNFAALRDSSASSEIQATATGLDLNGHSSVEVGINGSAVGTFTSSGFALASGKTLTGGTLSWTSWTPTGSWSTNTTYTGYRARIGNDLLARVKITLSGDPGAGALTVNLPSGLTIDTTAHASPAVSAAALGYGQGLDAGTLAYPLTVSYHSSDTLVVVNALTAGGTYAALSNASAVSDVPFDWQSGDSLGVEFRVTCTGW